MADFMQRFRIRDLNNFRDILVTHNSVIRTFEQRKI